MVVAPDGGLRRLRPRASRPRHLLGHRAASTPTPSSWAATASCGSSLCVVLAVIGVDSRRRLRLRRRPGPARRPRRRRRRRGALRTEPGPEATWKEVTPNLGWLLLGSVFAAALLNAGPIATDAARRPGPGRRRSRSSPTACCSPGSRCSCSRPCRPRCCPGSAAWPPAASSPSSAPGCKRLLVVVLVVGVVGTVGALVLGPFVIDVVYDADLDAAARSRCSRSAAPATWSRSPLAQAVIALQRPRARRRSAGSSASSRSCSRTWLVERRPVPAGRDRPARRRRWRR